MGRTKLVLLVLVAAAVVVTPGALAASARSAGLKGGGAIVADHAVPREDIGAGGGPGLPPPPSLGPGGAGKGKVMSVTVSGQSVVVKLRCAGVSGVRCALVLTLSAKQAGRRVTIGRATATLAGDTRKVVTVRLNGTGRRLVAADQQLPARLTITQGRRVRAKRALTITAKP